MKEKNLKRSFKHKSSSGLRLKRLAEQSERPPESWLPRKSRGGKKRLQGLKKSVNLKLQKINGELKRKRKRDKPMRPED